MADEKPTPARLRWVRSLLLAQRILLCSRAFLSSEEGPGQRVLGSRNQGEAPVSLAKKNRKEQEGP